MSTEVGGRQGEIGRREREGEGRGGGGGGSLPGSCQPFFPRHVSNPALRLLLERPWLTKSHKKVVKVLRREGSFQKTSTVFQSGAP